MDQSLFPTEGLTFSLRQRQINGNKISQTLLKVFPDIVDCGRDSPVLSGQVWVLLAKQGVVPSPEACPLVDDVENAGVPMKGHKQVVHETTQTEEIGIVGVTLGPVQKLPKSVNFDKTADPQHGLEVEGQVEGVQG